MCFASAHVSAEKPQAQMTLHHMHVMINHAVEMAAEGSNLIMLGNMQMATDIDNVSVQHGQMMIANAKKLVEKMLGGEAMKKLHASGAGKSSEMKHTHQMAEAALSYIKLLETMPSKSMHQH
jgi:hypothetical protein